MGLFGSRRNPWDTPGYGDGTPQGGPPLQDAPVLGGMIERDPAYASTPKSAFFGQGGIGRSIAGYIGDALLRSSGAAPIYQPMMMQRQQQAQEDARWQQRQNIEAENARQLYDYKQQHDLSTPTEYERLLAARGLRQGTPEYNSALDAKLFPPIPVQGFDSMGRPTITFAPRPSMGAGAVPTAPVGKLTPLGGPQAGPAGNFR